MKFLKSCRFKPLVLVFISLCGFIVANIAIPPQPAHAAGETFTWVDYQTIGGSGGNFVAATNFLRGQSSPTNEQFSASVEYNAICLTGPKGSFKGHFRMNIGLTSAGKATLNVPLNQTEFSNGQGTPLCDTSANSTVVKEYDGKAITLTGTRPPSGSTSETERQKEVGIRFNSSLPPAQAPKNITVKIETADGKNVGQAQIIQQSTDSTTGSVYFDATFHLDPNKYIVCATAVVTNCSDQSTITTDQKFTKIKFQPLLLTFGELYSDSAINVTITVPTTRACGQTSSFGPAIVTLKNAVGGTETSKTGTYTSTPFSNEFGSTCTVNGFANLYTSFLNEPAGTYTVCINNGQVCAQVLKVTGQPASVTLSASLNFQVPDEQPTCQTGTGWASAVAWILCPVTQIIVVAMSFIETNLIIPYLTVSPLTTSSDNPVFRFWQDIRNVANILFILAIFFIIFSQATSLGLNNYGIKRMLPRLVWVAIVANLSYYLIAFLIDSFNIFGAGIAQLMMATLTNGTAGHGGTTADWRQFFSISAIGIAGTVVTAGAAIGWLGSLIIFVFLLMLVTVIVLVLRQMLIILLVALSPLLAVAKLFPNTEKYSDKGADLLLKLLIMYPMIIAIFAISKIAGAILTTGDLQLASGAAVSTETSQAIKIIFATFIQAFPLIALPGLLLAEDYILGDVTSFIQRHSNTAMNNTKKAYQNSDIGKHRAKLNEERSHEIASGNYTGWRPGGRLRAQMNRSLNRSGAFNTITGGFGAHQYLNDQKLRHEAGEETEGYFNHDFELAEAWVESGGDRKSSAYTALNQAQRNTFDQMANSHLNHTGDSFAAAMKLIAENGRGSEAMAQQAFKHIRHHNPATAENDVAALATKLRVNWRKTGRGDLAGVNNTAPAPQETFQEFNISQSGAKTSAWADVNFKHMTPYVFDASTKNDVQSLRDYLGASGRAKPERVRQVVEALPTMEARSRRNAERILHELYSVTPGKRTVTGTAVAQPGGTTAPVYAADLDTFLDQIRQEFKLVPR